MELDRYYNLDHGSQESQGPDYTKFIEDLNQIEQDEDFKSKNPQVPKIADLQSVDPASKLKLFNEFVPIIVNKVYSAARASLNLKSSFNQFLNNEERIKDLGMYDLHGSLTCMREDIENAGKAMFNFAEIEDKFEGEEGEDDFF